MVTQYSNKASQYQVVVWGASGFTGKLVCEHIAQNYQGKIRWAMAGRDAGKLEQVKTDIARINPACAAVPVVIADAYDSSSLARMASQTDVIISTAGPFAKYGTKVVEACMEQRTHYCDITGEVVWVRRNIENYHHQARDKGVKIVHCCGFDSVPSDLGTLMVAEHLKSKGKKTAEVYSLFNARGGFSGGTVESGFTAMELEKPQDLSQALSDQYFLCEGKRGPDKPTPQWPQYIPQLNTWGAPFIMEPVNARVVHRSNALLDYSPEFKYKELSDVGYQVAAYGVSAGMAVGGVAMSIPIVRRLLRSWLPAPGSGPSKATQLSGFWENRIVGVSQEEGEAQPTVVKARCADSRDPGYWSTSRMVLEAGLCLATQGEELKEKGLAQGGVLTPATAMGLVLIERLKRAGMVFEVLEG